MRSGRPRAGNMRPRSRSRLSFAALIPTLLAISVGHDAVAPSRVHAAAPPPPDLLFVEGFESGTLDPWSAYYSGPTVCAPQYTVGFCNVQFPTVIQQIEGTSVTVYGRLYIAGLTDASPTNGAGAPQVMAQLGYGPDGTDPSSSVAWVWSAAIPNPGYSGAENDDEYQALLVVPSPPGEYDFAYRMSGTCGATFTYCDADAEGSTDGYAPADAGQMTSQPAG